MQNDTTEKLNIIMHHIPSNLITSSHPMILINRFVALDTYKIMLCCQIPVKIICCYFYGFIFDKTTGCILHYCKNFRKYFVQSFFILIKDIFFYLINFIPNSLSLIKIQVLYTSFQIGNTLLIFCNSRLYSLSYIINAST